MRNELRFILLSVEFSICDTLRKTFRSSFSRSREESSRDAEAWKRKEEKKMVK